MTDQSIIRPEDEPDVEAGLPEDDDGEGKKVDVEADLPDEPEAPVA